MGFDTKIAKQKPVGTVKYALDSITLGGDETPVLELRFAGKGNGAYMSALLKQANERRRVAAGKLTERKLDAARALEAEIFARTVLAGWEHVYEDETPGMPCPFSQAKAEELLLALAEHRPESFDALTGFAKDPDNFPQGAIDSQAGLELGKK